MWEVGGGDINSSKEANTKTFFDYLLHVSDDVLANFPIPDSATSEKSEVENICTNAVFNQCTINFVVNSKI